MDRRIETRVVDTGGVALTTLIQKDACEVWWISIMPKALATSGIVQVYDGFDKTGKCEWHYETGYSEHCNFIPPIPCDYGLAIYNDANITSYTIGYRPKKWRKEQ